MLKNLKKIIMKPEETNKDSNSRSGVRIKPIQETTARSGVRIKPGEGSSTSKSGVRIKPNKEENDG